MTNEERKKLKKDYDEFSKKNYYGSTLMYPLYFAFGFSLIIFWLPKDILTQYPSLKYFTQFMADIFPNINVFVSRSKIPELTEFYFSYMWLIAILMTVYAITLIPKANEEAKKFFGTGKYKGIGKLPHRFIEVADIDMDSPTILLLIFWILLVGNGMYMFYMGDIINGTTFRMNTEGLISKRFGMFFITNLGLVVGVWINIYGFITAYLIKINIKKIKREKQIKNT